MAVSLNISAVSSNIYSLSSIRELNRIRSCFCQGCFLFGSRVLNLDDRRSRVLRGQLGFGEFSVHGGRQKGWIDPSLSVISHSWYHLSDICLKDIEQILVEAQHRWLRPAEICEVLQNYRKFRIAPEPPRRPQSGSIFLFDRKVLRYFRKDGHNWRKKKDGKTVKEAHERLKVGSVDMLHCYYAHGEENEKFQRRSYWMLEGRARDVEEVARVIQMDSPVTSFSATTQSQPPSQLMGADSSSSAHISEYEDAESAGFQTPYFQSSVVFAQAATMDNLNPLFLWFPRYHGLASAVNAYKYFRSQAYKYFQDGSLKQYGYEGTDKPKETWVNLWMLGLHIHSWFRFINGRRLLSLLQHHLGISERPTSKTESQGNPAYQGLVRSLWPPLKHRLVAP
ncbi:leucine rich repeat domain containing protein [Musa troglodytarum]|uniref:Leucine rich repeat domain containing protein n=1 Tax=Musa troglodytarum TaxID=320322 RepID=A0A9E7HQ41_9LILI|nr:leucine rich repeat domain containing protein [Musa troglodytarum]